MPVGTALSYTCSVKSWGCLQQFTEQVYDEVAQKNTYRYGLFENYFLYNRRDHSHFGIAFCYRASDRCFAKRRRTMANVL